MTVRAVKGLSEFWRLEYHFRQTRTLLVQSLITLTLTIKCIMTLILFITINNGFLANWTDTILTFRFLLFETCGPLHSIPVRGYSMSYNPFKRIIIDLLSCFCRKHITKLVLFHITHASHARKMENLLPRQENKENSSKINLSRNNHYYSYIFKG